MTWGAFDVRSVNIQSLRAFRRAYCKVGGRATVRLTRDDADELGLRATRGHFSTLGGHLGSFGGSFWELWGSFWTPWGVIGRLFGRFFEGGRKKRPPAVTPLQF